MKRVSNLISVSLSYHKSCASHGPLMKQSLAILIHVLSHFMVCHQTKSIRIRHIFTWADFKGSCDFFIVTVSPKHFLGHQTLYFSSFAIHKSNLFSAILYCHSIRRAITSMELSFLNKPLVAQELSPPKITSRESVIAPPQQKISPDTPLAGLLDQSITMPSNTHPMALLWGRRLQLENRKIYNAVQEKHSALDSELESVKVSTDARICELERQLDGNSTSLKALLHHVVTILEEEWSKETASVRADFLEKTQNINSPKVNMHDNITKTNTPETNLQTIEPLTRIPARSESTTLKDGRLQSSQFPSTPAGQSQTQNYHQPNDPLLTRVNSQISLNPQGNAALEDYLSHAEEQLNKQLEIFVTHLKESFLQTFVNGLDKKSHRTALHKKLEQVGWT